MKIKTLSIGDTHGRNLWKFIDFSPYNFVFFIGDYPDSFNYSDEDIMHNLLDIIALKKSNPKKFILLWGNHDVQYFIRDAVVCTGFRPSMASGLNIIFNDNKHLFNYAYQIQNVLWTHAGASASWVKSIEHDLNRVGYENDMLLAEGINRIGSTSREVILHTVDKNTKGFDPDAGILWARNTHKDMLPGIHQIYGHTPVRGDCKDCYGTGIVLEDNGDLKNEKYIDCKTCDGSGGHKEIKVIKGDNCTACNIDCLSMRGVPQLLEIEIDDEQPTYKWEDLNPKIIRLETKL